MKFNRIDKLTRELDWNLLHTYTVICEEKSITRAADRLFLRQPTVSNALKRLEQSLGSILIERRKGVFTLTDSGQSLYQQARLICDQVSHIIGSIQGADSSVTGHISLAMASHIHFEPLNQFLTGFHASYPDITFSIDILTSIDVANAVKSGEASTGICLVHRKRRGLNYKAMYKEYFGFFCGPPHPLFNKKDLKLSDLNNQSIVSFNTDRMMDVLRPVALYRTKANIDGKIIGVSSSLEEVRRMITCGLGYGPLPYHVVYEDIKNNKLWQLPPYKKLPAVDAYVVTKDTIRLTQAETLFQTELVKMIDGLSDTQKNLKP